MEKKYLKYILLSTNRENAENISFALWGHSLYQLVQLTHSKVCVCAHASLRASNSIFKEKSFFSEWNSKKVTRGMRTEEIHTFVWMKWKHSNDTIEITNISSSFYLFIP